MAGTGPIRAKNETQGRHFFARDDAPECGVFFTEFSRSTEYLRL